MEYGWLVFFGTSTVIVRARDENGAYLRFRQQHWPSGNRTAGYVIPPERDEVHVRRLTEKDLGWINDSGDERFARLARQALK